MKSENTIAKKSFFFATSNFFKKLSVVSKNLRKYWNEKVWAFFLRIKFLFSSFSNKKVGGFAE